MEKGYDYTESMDQMIRQYQKKNLLTEIELTQKLDLSEGALAQFRRRNRISAKSIKKIKKATGLNLQDA